MAKTYSWLNHITPNYYQKEFCGYIINNKEIARAIGEEGFIKSEEMFNYSFWTESLLKAIQSNPIPQNLGNVISNSSIFNKFKNELLDIT